MIQRVDLELHIETAPILKIHSPKLLVVKNQLSMLVWFMSGLQSH